MEIYNIEKEDIYTKENPSIHSHKLKDINDTRIDLSFLEKSF